MTIQEQVRDFVAQRTLCHERQISVINGFCPLMFLNHAAWPHRLHGWIVRQTRAYRNAPA